MKMRIFIISLGIAFLLGGRAYPVSADMGQDAHRDFDAANTAYRAGKYNEAVISYEKILSQGVYSGSIYYNLGNAYFKSGDLGRAVLNYERARISGLWDSDLKSNYDYAKELLGLTSLDTQEAWSGKFLGRMFRGMGLNSLAGLVSSLYIVAILVLIMNIIFPQFKKVARSLLVLALLALIPAVFALFHKVGYLEKGAVVVKENQVRFEPQENATAYFKLIPGSSVEVIEQAQGWCKIKRPDDKAGWVAGDSLEFISR